MKHEDEDLLYYVKRRPFCEWCLKPRGHDLLQPHHILRRGMGGGGRLDKALNLIAVCPGKCHQEAQEGGQKARRRCLKIVAEREGIESGRQVLFALYRLQRKPKES